MKGISPDFSFMIKDRNHLRVVLYEGKGSQPFTSQQRFSVISTLLEKGFAMTSTGNKGSVAPADQSSLLVLGQFDEGTAPQMEDIQGQVSVQFQQVDGAHFGRIIEFVETTQTDLKIKKPGEWRPWFPVIDYDRCTNCMQCLSFCLFGVYGVSEDQKIQVQNEDQCKTNCPACSRVCPEVAIMFPKYKAGPINGDVVNTTDLQREKMKVDISALLGGDIYATLRERSARAKSRFAKERDPDKALKERQRCLVELQKQGDIPIEVLMSLPSPEEIQRRTQEALTKNTNHPSVSTGPD